MIPYTHRKVNAIKPLRLKESNIAKFWHRYWLKAVAGVLVVAAVATLYFSSRKEDKPLIYEQQVQQLQAVQTTMLPLEQVESAEKMFVGAQRLKVEFDGRQQDYLRYLSAYSAMINTIANKISALGVTPKDEKRFFVEFIQVFKASYWKKSAERQDDALYKSLDDGWYDCDGSTIVLRDVAAKLGKSLTLYFAWKVEPGLQTGHSFAAGNEYAFETAYSDTFPVKEIGRRYPFVYGSISSTFHNHESKPSSYSRQT